MAFKSRHSSKRTADRRPETPAPASWERMLEEAVNVPGTMSAAFKAFPTYSVGNQMLAWIQFVMQGKAPQPIATYKRWKELGRQVRRGETASITLCVRRTFKRKPKPGEESEDGQPKVGAYFTYQRQWFPRDSTDGPEVELPKNAEWDGARAIEALGLRLVPFHHQNGNVAGYSYKRDIALNSESEDQPGTLGHELAHAWLHQDGEGQEIIDGPDQPRNMREVEAEAVALILAEVLGWGYESDHRGYIQHWYKSGEPIPDVNARRIFSCAEAILKAGRPTAKTEASEPETEEAEELEAVAA